MQSSLLKLHLAGVKKELLLKVIAMVTVARVFTVLVKIVGLLQAKLNYSPTTKLSVH